MRRLLSFQESGDSPAGDASTASEQLVRAVSVQLRPLLVRAAALRALLAGQSEPEDLVDSGGAEYLAASLGLPSAREALALVHLHPHRAAVLGRWCPQLSCRAPGNPPPPTPDRALRVPRPLARPGLMPMPQLYRHMFLALEDSVCDHCGCHPTEPVLCLLTGAFLCCDSHSGCLSHAWLHGAGTGVYLLIKASERP